MNLIDLTLWMAITVLMIAATYWTMTALGISADLENIVPGSCAIALVMTQPVAAPMRRLYPTNRTHLR